MSRCFIKADWPVPDNVHALVTTRLGGYSQPPYDSLNLAYHVGDSAKDVEKNRSKLLSLLKLESEPCWLDQTHSVEIIRACRDNIGTKADGCYTAETGQVCVVMTADCLPVTLYNREKSRVAAVHAGWRGLASGILEQGVAQVGTENTVAWLGPAIGPKHFEVGEDVYTAFTTANAEHQKAFIKKNSGKWLADIYRLARQILKQLGVSEVYGGSDCTVANDKTYYSFRRDKITGRMATLVWMS